MYWTAVMCYGVGLGLYFGHPDVAVPVLTDAIAYPASPTAEEARFTANAMMVLSTVCLLAVVGREAVLEDPGGGVDE